MACRFVPQVGGLSHCGWFPLKNGHPRSSVASPWTKYTNGPTLGIVLSRCIKAYKWDRKDEAVQ